MSDRYKFNDKADLTIIRNEKFSLDLIKSGITKFDATIKQMFDSDLNISTILGMRNLSSFVGEVFAASLIASSNQRFKKNPHQDGYPDLLLMDDVGIKIFADLAGRHREKDPFSPFAGGGVEIKATVGSVPTPQFFAKKGLQKPDIGDQRIDVLKSYDWKAHHRDTNHLLAIVWDFIETKPTICGIFYQSKLTTDHWGKIISPKEGGGRTTSVSIMTREGVATMYQNWVAVINDPRYIQFFNKYNSGKLIS